jgi:hypothetical protein
VPSLARQRYGVETPRGCLAPVCSSSSAVSHLCLLLGGGPLLVKILSGRRRQQIVPARASENTTRNVCNQSAGVRESKRESLRTSMPVRNGTAMDSFQSSWVHTLDYIIVPCLIFPVVLISSTCRAKRLWWIPCWSPLVVSLPGQSIVAEPTHGLQ